MWLKEILNQMCNTWRYSNIVVNGSFSREPPSIACEKFTCQSMSVQQWAHINYQVLLTISCYTLLYSPIAFFTTVVWDSTTNKTNITNSSTVRKCSYFLFMCTISCKLPTLNLRFCIYIKEIEKWIIRQEPTERLAAPTARICRTV